MAARKTDVRFRHPRTHNECRNYEEFIEDDYYDDEFEINVKVRGKRKPKSLPSFYDDMVFSDKNDRNWKKKTHKRKQWM